jgi:DNA-binding transcriptional regulator YiaG
MSAVILRLPVPARHVAEQIEVDVAGVRRALGLTRASMAVAFGVARRDLELWERGESRPVGLAKVLLVVASREPDAVRRTLVEMGVVRR